MAFTILTIPSHYVFFGAAVVGLAVVFILFKNILDFKVPKEKAYQISEAIHDGAMTFLQEEYSIIGIVVAVLAMLIGLFGSLVAAGVFVLGALFSLTTGFLGMKAATQANVRTTLAAKEKGEHAAFMMAFLGGGVMGFAVASFGLLGLGLLFYFFVDSPQFASLLTSFGLGGSLVAFFCTCWWWYFHKIC